MSESQRRGVYAAWLALIAGCAALHFVHLSADFPNHSPWIDDWAKYTDEGWYGAAAIRAHLLGHWFLPGDLNTAVALPVWPLLEWLLFLVTGVKIEAARALSVAFFCVDLGLTYGLVRARGSRWAGLLAVTLAVTSPFLYAFSRLAILEPLLMAATLLALNLAVRLSTLRRPGAVSAGIGLLFSVMLLTKTSAVFLLPALGWAMLTPVWKDWKLSLKCAAAAGLSAAASYGGWMALVAHVGRMPDYKYLFYVNEYVKPTEWYWPVLSLGWSAKGTMWIGRLVVPLAALVVLLALAGWRAPWSRRLRQDAAFGASVLGSLGYIGFMTYQNHPQPRYYVVIAFFVVVVVAQGADALGAAWVEAGGTRKWPGLRFATAAGALVLVTSLTAVVLSAVRTAGYVLHPAYTWTTAARELTRYIDQHPGGNRLLLSVSGDEIMLMTHLPALCDDYGTEELVHKIDDYQPGWWATWNDIDPGTLEDLHVHFDLEQAASFRALDHPERNTLVLFRLKPLAEARVPGPELQQVLPGDRIEIPVE